MNNDRKEAIRALYGVNEVSSEFVEDTANVLFAQTCWR